MGETRVLLKVYGADDKAVEVEALVDTGATFTKIPEEQAISLGLQARYETEVELADGRRIGRKLALAEVELAGVRNRSWWRLEEKVKNRLSVTPPWRFWVLR